MAKLSRIRQIEGASSGDMHLLRAGNFVGSARVASCGLNEGGGGAIRREFLLRRRGLAESAVYHRMGLGEKTLDALAIDGEMMVLARNQVLLLEVDQMLSYPRSRCTNQLGNVAMSGVHGQADSFSIADSEVLAQLEQNQREALLERATHEIRASQLDQIPAPEITGCHPLEVFRIDPERYLNKFFQRDGSYLAVGHCLAAEVVGDPNNPRRKTGHHPRRNHHQQGAHPLAIAARYPRDPGEQHVGVPVSILFLGDYAASFDAADDQRTRQFVQLARGEPRNIPKSA